MRAALRWTFRTIALSVALGVCLWLAWLGFGML